ncbi:hypothetical protein CDAR_400591 [Caerostris darwini]|uniref:Uncharacterized protein n=1 Tax=Caerostris darwini TaxID=1538125 RepID=A0AAV4QJW6_9ARAC|nr:hypothetical protein CDAR_400591 [Caerostris darwini]
MGIVGTLICLCHVITRRRDRDRIHKMGMMNQNRHNLLLLLGAYDSSELYKADFEFSRTPTSQSSATKQRDAVELDDAPPVKESFSSTRTSSAQPEEKSRSLSRFRERNVAPKRKPQLNLRKRISHQDQLNSRNKESNDTPKKVIIFISALFLFY